MFEMFWSNLYTILPVLVFVVLLGYVLRRWYRISLYTYGAWLIIVAFFLALGYFMTTWYGLNPYMVGGIYAAIVVGYLAARWYHISWKDIMGKFYRPRPTT